LYISSEYGEINILALFERIKFPVYKNNHIIGLDELLTKVILSCIPLFLVLTLNLNAFRCTLLKKMNCVGIEKNELQNSNTNYAVESQILPVSSADVCFVELR